MEKHNLSKGWTINWLFSLGNRRVILKAFLKGPKSDGCKWKVLQQYLELKMK